MKNIRRLISTLISLAIIILPTSVYSAVNTKEEPTKVYVGGDVFGIKMYSDGALIVETQGVETESGIITPAVEAGILPGDIIITANGRYIDRTETLEKEIASSETEEIIIKIKRDNEYFSKTIKRVTDKNGNKKLGLWVKDSAAGLGTISFYTENGKYFSALGHGIYDKQTEVLIPLSKGELCKASITSVTKSKNSKVGTLNGYFTDETVGKALTNKESGIYCENSSANTTGSLLEIAEPTEIAEGEAKIYTTIEGSEPKAYNINVVKILSTNNNKNMIIEITDKDLLNVTGGIVQGMSGSPIIQNNKVIGVLSHVFTDDVKKGYAIFAKTMLETTNSLY